MVYQIFSELMPVQFDTVRMYTAPFGSNLGSVGTLLIVNQGNAMVNSGNIAADYNNDSDYVRVGLSAGVVLGQDGYIMYDTLLPPNHMTQLQGINLQSGQSLFVYSQKGQSSFVFTGSTVTV
jgi:hypothetical protein